MAEKLLRELLDNITPTLQAHLNNVDKLLASISSADPDTAGDILTECIIIACKWINTYIDSGLVPEEVVLNMIKKEA